jgi:hypothetical protein
MPWAGGRMLSGNFGQLFVLNDLNDDQEVAIKTPKSYGFGSKCISTTYSIS